MKLVDLVIPSGAIFSEDRKYRYALWRVWSQNRPIRLQIGLNPSKAGAIKNDPTITRGIKRADRDGFGGFMMGNLFGFVSINPEVLLGDGEFVGIENDNYLKQMIELASGKVLCGWGSFKPVSKRASIVLSLIKEPYCLGVNADGQPKHPLYISYDVKVVKYLVTLKALGGE